MQPPLEQEAIDIFNLFTPPEQAAIASTLKNMLTTPLTAHQSPSPFHYSNETDKEYIEAYKVKKGKKRPLTNNRVVMIWHSRNHWEMYIDDLEKMWTSFIEEKKEKEA